MRHQTSEGTSLKKLTVGRLLAAALGVLLVGLSGALLGGCTELAARSEEPVTRDYALVAFESCDALDAYVTEMATDMFVQSWVNGSYGYATRGGAIDVDFDEGAAPSADGDSQGGPTQYTTTNVQEAGVDELDLVKTNGNTLFYVQDSVLHVVDAWPPEQADALATLPLTGWGDALFLSGDMLVAFTSIAEGGSNGCDDVYCEPKPMPATDAAQPGAAAPTDGDERPDGGSSEPVPTEPPFNAVRATFVDVSNPAAPVVVRTLDLQGSLVSARLVNGVVYVATMLESWVYDPDLYLALEAAGVPDPWSLSQEEREAMADTVRSTVTPIIAEYVASEGRAALLPDVRVDSGDRSELFACSDLMRPGHRAELAVLSVVVFAPTAASQPDGVALLARGWHVYGSQSALYIAQDSRWWWFGAMDQPEATTNVHQFALGDGAPVYLASGEVPGWLLSQFSMSEHDGSLRVATTDQSFGDAWRGGAVADAGTVSPEEPVSTDGGAASSEPEPAAPAAGVDQTGDAVVEPEPEPEPVVDANNVFVLQRLGDELQTVGQVRGLAPGEQIFAVRFIGERGYVVTYRQVDPLYVIDLSVPSAPRVMGELHVTGFSRYLHPFGADYLIGIGREGTDTGQVLGLQLQLFDVSDPATPTRIHQTLLSTGEGWWSYSEAEYDHHAFTFYASRKLLAIPVTLEDWSWDAKDYQHFSGVIVYAVSVEDGFVELGRSSHTSLVTAQYCDGTVPIGPDRPDDVEGSTPCEDYTYPWYATMRRSIFADDALYAISNVGLTVSYLEALDAPVATVTW